MRLSRRARYAAVGLGIVATWVLLGRILGERATWQLLDALADLAERRFGHMGEQTVHAFLLGSIVMAQMALIGATIAAPIGMLVRGHARLRLRASGRDMLAPLRGRLAARSWPMRALTWAPTAIATAITVLTSFKGWWLVEETVLAAVAITPAAFALTALVRRYLAILAAPPAREEDLVTKATGDDELFFSAVAVTREARGLVAAFALANVGVVAAVIMLPVTMLHVSAYAALAMVGALAYRRASRIAVGLDGVLVTGTSRRRFFGYRDLDAVAIAASGDIVLLGRDREVLRLQLVGDDTSRLSAIVDRIRAGIDRARAQAGDSAQRFAETASAEALAHAAYGRANYRGRAASREDLLALVESPATDASARAAAAGALGQAADAGEQQRLRVAAGLCAEPDARAVLLRVAAHGPAGEEEEADEEVAPARRATLSR